MSSIRDKLNRLKGTSGRTETSAPPSNGEAGGSGQPSAGQAKDPAAEEREAQESTRPSSGLPAPSAPSEPPAAIGRSTRSIRVDNSLHPAFLKLGISEQRNAYGEFLLRRIEYPLDHRHGHYALGELLHYAPYLEPIARRQNKARLGAGAAEKAAALSKKKPSAKDLYRLPRPETAEESENPSATGARRLLFLDTETTGLGVGAGNVPFMIGFACYEEERGSLFVEQTLIRHPGEEKAMLHYLLGRMGGRTHLVTFNGRTFDWPVLVNRFILNGWRPSGAEPFHLDFLHPSRALWRNTLESCRLSRIEGDRLGIRRHEDVPGSLAPELYMRYLNDGDASHLEGVYLHNELDVLTLVTLSTHFGALLASDPEDETALPEAAEELYRTAAWLELHGEQGKAERLFAELIGRSDASAERWLLPAADRFKKQGRYEQAVELWVRAARKAETAAFPAVAAHVELAMHYEHRCRDYRLALEYAERALELIQRLPGSGRESPKRREEREALLHRLERLRRKSRTL
ncbi:ribonuclease H-like domain-containing protein [Cohnella sp. AR92]|uniref:ribonuclease H-like domain-containing protein n=1 Tax=Cohnella sp. AR92 TaxID=648716 RepID=UPI000F8CAC35|nr:ribonuclease H-like domain-containing protein [Cohnella sp. AR92]RUS46825.1 hypothetical protein ELR57_10470 [Cohnella sp. AR92]